MLAVRVRPTAPTLIFDGGTNRDGTWVFTYETLGIPTNTRYPSGIRRMPGSMWLSMW